VKAVSDVLSEIRTLRNDELRVDLSERLQEVWGGIAVKDYVAELQEGFHLRMTKYVGGTREPVRGTSTGEKQVLALAFVGTLVDKARATAAEAAKSREVRLFAGGHYGLVIDSAFGQLEDEYRRDVARWVPKLAPQVIVLVSQTQWRREVEEELMPRIGREWVLRCVTTKQRGKTISVRGTAYDYIVESPDGFESTTLIEVPA
jgi:DNA sulfur modification protein DndD